MLALGVANKIARSSSKQQHCEIKKVLFWSRGEYNSELVVAVDGQRVMFARH